MIEASAAYAVPRALRMRSMDSALEAFCNLLAEAERAGGRVLFELSESAEPYHLRETLKKVAHDEGYWAGELAAYLRRSGGTPSSATGDFADKVHALSDFNAKLDLLNKGQRWVIRKIEEQLPRTEDQRLCGFLSAMAESHRHNIALVDEALKAVS